MTFLDSAFPEVARGREVGSGREAGRRAEESGLET